MNKSQRPKSRKAQREETRAAVLEAGESAFATRGFEGTSLRVVADAAGVPVPLIVYHFGSKMGLWQAVVDAVFARMNERVAEADAALAASPTPATLRASIRAHVGAIVETPSYLRLTLQEGTEASERLTWMVERHQGPFTERVITLIEQAQAGGLLPPEADPMMLKYLVAGAVSLPFALGPEYTALTGRDTRTDAFAEAYVDLCLKVLTSS